MPLSAEDEELAVAQGAGDLVGSGEQAAETAGQGAERGDVGAADEADRAARSPSSTGERPTTASAEAAGVDDDDAPGPSAGSARGRR